MGDTPASSTDDTVARFIDKMCETFPALGRARDTHLRDSGEVIPFLLMSEVARHIEALHEAGMREGGRPRDEVVRLLAFLEGGYAAGDESVQQLIEAAFVESLAGPSPTYSGIRPLIGPTLRRAIEANWPDRVRR